MSEREEDGAESLSTGEQLKRAREAKGLSLDDVASQTRIPIRHLQSIEQEDWDALPAPTYAVGFARNYANAVGLDGAALASALRERMGGAVRSRAPAAAEYYEPADPSRVPPKGLVIGALLFAAVLALLYYFFFASWRDGESPAPAPAEAPPTEQSAPAPAAAAAAPVTGAVRLTATGEVWLRITDGAGGAQLFSGSLTAGQSFDVPATAQRPVIRTGRPHLLRASAGGRDLGPLAPEERTIDGVSLLAQDLAARGAQGGNQPMPGAAPLAAPPPSLAPGAEPRQR